MTEENKVQNEAKPPLDLLLNDRALYKSGVFMIVYKGCVIVKDDKMQVDSNVHRWMDFLIPPLESGIIEFQIRKPLSKIYNRIGLTICTPTDLQIKSSYNLLIKLRNLIFLEAMLFVKINNNLYRLTENGGPVFISINNSGFSTIWKQLMKKDHGRS